MCSGLRLKQHSTDTSGLSGNFTRDHALRMFLVLRVDLKEDPHKESKDGGWHSRKYMLLIELKINWHVCGNRKNEGNRC